MKRITLAIWALSATVSFGQWYIEAGPWVRGNMEIEVQGGSHASEKGVLPVRSGTQGNVAYIPPLSLNDDGEAQIFRDFDDGYVGPSGRLWMREAGETGYYGYDAANQYDPETGTLLFSRGESASVTRQRTVTRLSSGVPGWTGKADLDGTGALATVGYTFVMQRLFSLSFQFQVGWLDQMDARFHNQQAWSQQATWVTYESAMSREQSWTYTYQTYGIVPLPTAPFYETDSRNDTNPTISDRPIGINAVSESFVTTDRMTDRRQATAVSHVDLHVEANLLTLAFGPRFCFRPMERLSLLIQGGVTANLLDAGFMRTETYAWEDGRVIQEWSDHAEDQKWLWGATLSAGLQYDFTKRIYLHAAGGYDWVQNSDFSVGPDRIHMDVSGWRAEIAVGYEFGR